MIKLYISRLYLDFSEFSAIMTNSLNRDSFNICTNANTDGLIKCLPQPGLVRNQLFKSMLAASSRLLNLVYPDSSCTRDKVNGAAGRRAVGSVFCSPFIKFTVTSANPDTPPLRRGRLPAPDYTTEPLVHIFGIVRLSPSYLVQKDYS